jgi:adenylosuccinate lyase
MLKRYSREGMETVWSEAKKFYFWLLVEVTVLRARFNLNEFSFSILGDLEDSVKIDPEEIN